MLNYSVVYVLTIEHVSAHIIPEHVYAITILFILDLRPRNINCQMFRHLGLGISSRHNITMKVARQCLTKQFRDKAITKKKGSVSQKGYCYFAILVPIILQISGYGHEKRKEVYHTKNTATLLFLFHSFSKFRDIVMNIGRTCVTQRIRILLLCYPFFHSFSKLRDLTL